MKGGEADAQCAENFPQVGATIHTWKIIVIYLFMLNYTPAALHWMEMSVGVALWMFA